jgi:hypothetical protein
MIKLIRLTLLAASLIFSTSLARADSLIGRENLAAFFAAQVKARWEGRPIRIHIVGDSKVVGNALTISYHLDSLLPLASNGYPVIVTASGFGGMNTGYWAGTVADITAKEHADADLLIVDFGTNDRSIIPQTTEETTANNVAALTIIRKVAPISSMSVLILGQTPANRPAASQTTPIMMEINGALKEAARQTNSAYFETLDLFQRAHSEAGWMEQIPPPDVGGNVHPGDPLNLVLVGELSKVLFPLPFREGFDPSLINGWAPWQKLPEYSPHVYRDGSVVSFTGVIEPGYTAGPTYLFMLSPPYRPKTKKIFTVATDDNGSNSTIIVLPSGAVMTGAPFKKSYIALDQINFHVDR